MTFCTKTRLFAVAAIFLLSAAAAVAADLSLLTTGGDVTPVQTKSPFPEVGYLGGTIFSAEGDVLTGETGEPDIPWLKTTVLLPLNADLSSVSVHLEEAQYSDMPGIWQIDPVPPIATSDENGNPVLVWPKERTFANGRDTAIYSANAFWPQQPRVVHAGRLHQWRLAEVAVPLMQYNPVSGKLKELISGSVIVDYTAHGKARLQDQIHLRGRGRGRAEKLAINFAAAAGEYDALELVSSAEIEEEPAPAGVDSDGYVIITTSAIAAASTKLNNFVAHKQSLGWNVSVITESQWGGGTGQTGAVNIRNWLRNNYQTMDILYVLLIGDPHPDTGSVPMHLYNDREDDIVPTDMLYSDMSSGDNWDRYWELIVGRIPYYGTISAVDNILQKTINYENSQQVLWRWKALLPMVPLDETTPSYQCGQQIKADILVPDDILSTRIYEEDYGLTPPPEFLLSERYPATEWGGQPYGLMVWMTHGSSTSASEVITSSATSGLNDSYPSAVYEGSCSNAYPENSNNLAFRILQNGGINTVAATRVSWYIIGQSSYTSTSGRSIGSLAYQYAKNIVTNRQTCGMALAEAKQILTNLIIANYIRMVTYGDPSVLVYVDPDFTPPAPDPMTWENEPNEIGPGTITMTATAAVDDGGGPVQYYFDCVTGGGFDSGWQNSPTYTDTSVVQVYNEYRVKARDLSDYYNETAWSTPNVSITISPYSYGGTARAIPGKVEAEHFNVGGQNFTYNDTTLGNSGGQLRTREDVDIVSITDTVAGYAVDNISTGEWLTFTVNSLGGDTDLHLRVASEQEGGRIIVTLDDLELATLDVPNTGSLTAWQIISAEDLTLPVQEGAVLKVEFVGTGYRLNWISFQKQLPYHGSPSALPGRVEFEDFDIGGQYISYYDNSPLVNNYGQYRPDEGVEIAMINDPDPNYAVYADQPEWLEYTCSIQPGYYTVVIRSASTNVSQMTLREDGQYRASFTLPNTGTWGSWQSTSVSNIFFAGGEDAVLRLSLDSSAAFLNYIEFIRQYNAADINQTEWVDLEDLRILSSQWQGIPGDPSADIAPAGGDGQVDMLDLILIAENWLCYY